MNGSDLGIEFSHQAADVLRSLPEFEALKVAVTLRALRAQAARSGPPGGLSAREFLEAAEAAFIDTPHREKWEAKAQEYLAKLEE